MKRMNTHFCLVVILVIFFHGSLSEAKTGCKVILSELADAQMQFVGCMVRKSWPAKSCMECIKFHGDMTQKYDVLVSNANCSKEIINKNRLNIAYNAQKQLADLWNKGFCDDCFDEGDIISNQTQKFVNLTTAFSDCVNTFKANDKICIKCSPFYDDLNTFYKEMDKKKQGRICFDTQDSMNSTRSLWSKDLKCCQREYNLTFFIIASSMFGVLPIIFYFGMYSYTKRMERNHEVLDAGFNTGHASTSATVQSSSTSRFEERPIRRDSSSDEDIIDNLKKQRDVGSVENTAQQNTVHPENVKILKEATQPTSSNTISALIDL